jgi:hypothetical protein
MSKDTHLTERQIKVFRLRARGHTQAEIARQFGTSRANISAIEKKAMINIDRAKNTLNLTKMLEAPLWFIVKPEEDLNDIVKKIYEKADSNGIHISQNFPALANLIQEKAKEKIRGRRVILEMEIAITKDGEVLVR